MSLIAYGLIALAILGAIGTGVYKVKQWGAEEVRAELQPKLDACAGEVEKHNAAAKALSEESARRLAQGAVALRKAEGKAKVWEGQASRLTAILTAPRKAGEATPTSCDAAWAEIRKPQ